MILSRHRQLVCPTLLIVGVLGIVVSVAAVYGKVAHAQRPTDDSPATIHVESQLVVLDVVVTDAKGNPVANLNQGDFSVFENGVRQELRTFEAPPQEKETLASLPIDPPKDKNGNDDWGDAPLTILVMDTLNTPFEEAGYSRYEVERYLKAQPELLKQPTTILWLNDRGFHPITPLTRHRDNLLSAVASHGASMPDKMARGDLVSELSSSLSALQQIALFSRGHRGSKQIIWVGRSFPGVDATYLGAKQQDILKSAVSSTIDLLMKSRATIYVIDPTVNSIQPGVLVSAVPAPLAVTATSSFDPFATTFSFFSFVEQTGGKYFYGRNDLDGEIEQSIERGTTFYTLTYVPKVSREDERYRKIDIRLTDPTLKIQAKQGYYPHLLQDAAPDARALEFGLREALVTGMAYTGVGVKIDSCKIDSKLSQATCAVIVDNDSLTFTANDSDTSKRSMIVAAIASLDGKLDLLASNVLRLGVEVPANRTIKGGLGGTKLVLQVGAGRKTSAIRVAVRDASGRIGTASLDVRLAQVSRDGTTGQTH